MKVETTDLVNVTMIAERAGVPRTNANAWTRSKDFPAPVADVGGRLYLWSQVEVWREKKAEQHADRRES